MDAQKQKLIDNLFHEAEKKANHNKEVIDLNVCHLSSIIDILMSIKDCGMIRVAFNLHVNPYNGELMDPNYEGNKGFFVYSTNGKLSMDEKYCLLSRGARENISNSFFEFVERYL